MLGEKWGRLPNRDCALQPPPFLKKKCAALLFSIAMLSATPLESLAQDTHATPARVQLFPPLERMPLEGPLEITSSFGESRRGHFHAGLDFATGGKVGKPVLAPLSGRIERVRMSGIGYGRSLYMRSDDGRLLVFGHLDALEEPLASYVAAVQDSTGQYEQDLWPDASAFPVRAGQRIAWTGESGAGPPHLHMEIRRGDMALNPLRAGVTLADPLAPRLQGLTLEPLDPESLVEGTAVPYTRRLGSRPDTIEVIGRVRAVVTSADAIGSGRARVAPYRVGLELEGQTVECRFDSASWAGEMSEADYLYDRGRIVGEGGVVLWAPAEFHPKALNASGMPGGEWGRFEVRNDDPPRTLKIHVGDLAGNVTRREVVLIPPRRETAAPEAAPAAPGSEPRHVTSPTWSLTSLPGGALGLAIRDGHECRFDRVSLGDAGAPLRGTGNRRGAMLRPLARGTVRLSFGGTGSSPAGACRAESSPMHLAWLREGAEDGFAGLEWTVPAGVLFEPALVVAETLAHVAAPPELSLVGRAYAFHPAELALRQAVRFRLSVDDTRATGLGLYQESPEGRWEFVRSVRDSATGRLHAEARRLGKIAAFRDLTAPRIRSTAPRRAPRGPYSRWALETRLEERGSGVEARETYFEIDGRRVPSEWDSEANTLRWRPLAPPARGTHRYQLFARDRCGNLARAEGTFVLD